MSAAMELHVALSMRLDATEAYRLAHAYRDEVLARERTEPLVVSRFDVAMEPTPEEEPILTIGAIAEDGRPVALRLDEETRRKVAGWLAPTTADGQAYDGELAMLRGLVRTLRVVVRPDTVDVTEVRRLLQHHVGDDAQARTENDRQAALLDAIRQDPTGRWKSGRAVKVLRQLGYHPISPGTASHDLAALAAAGHLIRHEETGVRWYEVAHRGGNRA